MKIPLKIAQANWIIDWIIRAEFTQHLSRITTFVCIIGGGDCGACCIFPEGDGSAFPGVPGANPAGAPPAPGAADWTGAPP